MKIECGKEKLERALTLTERATSKNPTLPILSYVLLEATSNSLILRATNLDIGVEITLPAKVEKLGTLAVKGSTLLGFLTNSPKDKNVTLESSEGGLLVKTLGGSALVKTANHEDFPKISKVSGGLGVVMDASLLSSGIRSVSYSASISHIKPELASVVLYSDGKNLVFVSTDSFRLAEKRIKAELPKDIERTIIPIKNAVDLSRMAEDIEKEKVNVFFGKNQIAVEGGGIYFVSRVVEGVFPDYKQIIPKEWKTEVVVLKEDFGRAVKTSTVFSDSFNQTTISIQPSKKKMEFKSKNADVGEGEISISGAISGEAIDISFNHKYISDCLQSILSDSIAMSFSGNNKPTMIRGVGDTSFLYIVMPMNR
ncbi:MAG: DNA polymerase III subunit beta [Candidatus Taylorbacteria bacterium RIFCSPLOWO2_02_FULL_43_11]|uniref:Beta sliding clamp n=1 Tax=Candidatus Taylorbacteria bacterium RIFCSPHIGHO2_02_FULL_43_32b TaxID=1802306 RepID=A0A1G2MJH1_9BACT|nr:MAG: DNA polymerase III subunit beta [Candidatus Taylorbacteria bacterium RIFCSPHIGHO2_01_FULL_43_47]OHA24070.1 MAG: DNA polymerase III subunit beta [Candidatus Taylorbacteria bacterium RIFCSPHIGHO2_02_FULL_43_32b]OHA31466.1 MAG: DNA polymerase III subunit beta [Candidatus Taylorbacteria bacterium RIFCSPLOWO2_01_FULL_43_44]OHA37517.1 MAG: DNA polymerase III subunit beta [Candidatus Taylorbacteria bacterium RIFCSPLOWO2_02_FULL_43_11]